MEKRKSKISVKKTGFIRARTEPNVKQEAEEILHKLGLTPSNAINLFYSQIILNKGLPFEVKYPNEATIQTFINTDKGLNLTQYNSVDDFFKEMDC